MSATVTFDLNRAFAIKVGAFLIKNSYFHYNIILQN